MSEDVNLEVLDGGLGLLPAGADDVHAVIGCCDTGTDGSIFATRSIDALVAARGRGPAVQGAAVALKKTGKTVLFVKVPTTTAGHILHDDDATVAIASSTNASPIAVTTSTPHGLSTGDVVTITGHLVNTAANGTVIVTVTGATTFTIQGSTGNGVGAATGTVEFNGVSVGDSTGTSVPTVTGTPNDTYHVRWKWTAAGTRGTAGAKFKYSLDGGATWSAEFGIGTAVSYEIDEAGVTLNFAAGTWVLDDEIRFKTVEPKWAAADVADAIDTLGSGVSKFRLVHLVGDLSASDATTIDTALDGLLTSYRYVGLLGHARDADEDEVEEDWIDSLVADFGSFESSRVSVAAGHYQVSSPIDGHLYRRPASFVVAARLMDRPIQEHAGRVRTGALKGIQIPSETARTTLDLESLVYHDSRITTTLKDARFLTLRTRIGRPGLFVHVPAMMSSPSSDYQRWMHRSVIDKACDLTYEVLVDVLNDDLQLDPVTGFILDKEAKAIESRLKSAFRDGLLSKRAASAVSATVSRVDNIITTKTLTVSVRVVPKGYVEGIDVTVGFTNPALELGA